MFNGMHLTDLEKMGAGVIIKNRIRYTFKGTLYNGVLLGNDYEYQVKVLYYWLGGGEICAIVDSTKDEALAKEHQLEDKFEEAFMDDKNGIRTSVYTRIGLKLLCFIATALGVVMAIKLLSSGAGVTLYDSRIAMKLLVYVFTVLASRYIALKANTL